MARKRRVFRTAKMARRQARKRRSKISERRKKEFRWRGYSLEELQVMPLYPPDLDYLVVPEKDARHYPYT